MTKRRTIWSLPPTHLPSRSINTKITARRCAAMTVDTLRCRRKPSFLAPKEPQKHSTATNQTLPCPLGCPTHGTENTKYFCPFFSVSTYEQKGTLMTICPRRYQKDLSRTTGIRLSETLREEAEEAANYQGMTFSQFLRQSLRRNITLSKSIEEEVATRNFRAASGK